MVILVHLHHDLELWPWRSRSHYVPHGRLCGCICQKTNTLGDMAILVHLHHDLDLWPWRSRSQVKVTLCSPWSIMWVYTIAAMRLATIITSPKLKICQHKEAQIFTWQNTETSPRIRGWVFGVYWNMEILKTQSCARAPQLANGRKLRIITQLLSVWEHITCPTFQSVFLFNFSNLI